MIFINDEQLKVTIFPDNTSQVWKIDQKILDAMSIKIRWRFESEAEFIHLAQLKALLDSCDIIPILYIEYLPYARQDKEIKNDATFALRTFAVLLNSLNFFRIIINDPHSNVAKELINRSEISYPTAELNLILENTKSDIVCYPDSGARLKYAHIYIRKYVYGNKVRDPSTGLITSYALHGDVKDKNVLIVDDICDGGMTFILLTKKLKEAGAKEVNMFVTHGIFSKGLRPLREAGINKIFTAKGEDE